MNLYYNGVDIYRDVSVNYCVHEMFAEKQADTLVIRFNDTKGTWSKWQPAEGDTVQFKEAARQKRAKAGRASGSCNWRMSSQEITG